MKHINLELMESLSDQISNLEFTEISISMNQVNVRNQNTNFCSSCFAYVSSNQNTDMNLC